MRPHTFQSFMNIHIRKSASHKFLEAQVIISKSSLSLAKINESLVIIMTTHRARHDFEIDTIVGGICQIYDGYEILEEQSISIFSVQNQS